VLYQAYEADSSFYDDKLAAYLDKKIKITRSDGVVEYDGNWEDIFNLY